MNDSGGGQKKKNSATAMNDHLSITKKRRLPTKFPAALIISSASSCWLLQLCSVSVRVSCFGQAKEEEALPPTRSRNLRDRRRKLTTGTIGTNNNPPTLQPSKLFQQQSSSTTTTPTFGRDDLTTSPKPSVTTSTSNTSPATSPHPKPQVYYGCSYNDQIVPDWSEESIYSEGSLVANYMANIEESGALSSTTWNNEESSGALLNWKVFQCKSYPYSAWCNGYEPGADVPLPGNGGGTSMAWSVAWEEKGDCVAMVYSKEEQVMMVEEEEQGLDLTGSKFTTTSSNGGDFCATPIYRDGESYQAQDQVLYQDAVYECKSPPVDMWCPDSAYRPGESLYWETAWMLVADSLGCPVVPDPAAMPSDAPAAFEEVCAPIYSANKNYTKNDIVSHEHYNYQCQIEELCNDEFGLNAAGWWQKDTPCEIPPPKQESAILSSVSLDTTEASLSSESLNMAEEPPPLATLSPTAPPSEAPSSSEIQCAPPYTVGHNYKFMEELSFNYFNYACYIPDKCRQPQYAPRLHDENVGIAWWKTDECVGTQTRHPTVLPTFRPSYPQMAEQSADYIAQHDALYTAAIPDSVAVILEKSKMDIEKTVLLFRTASLEREPSSIYNYEGLLKALGVMTLHKVRSGNFYLGDGEGDAGTRYALVNLAAFLAHSMAESIKYDTCDESNWEVVNGRYPVSNACGQGGKSYQDMKCPEDESHMECPVKSSMSTRAVTHANWGSEPGAPTYLFCEPKSVDGTPLTGFWDPAYKCDRPFSEPPESCTEYEGQTTGRIDNSVPAANKLARIDVEGCCFWGRGVIKATGVCSIGRLNYFLGKGAADNGMPSPYPNIDFCEDPEVICGSAEHSELKWVAGMSEYVDRVQSYEKDGFSYFTELKRFFNEGMMDDSFIINVSKILEHGCHGDDASCHPADGQWEKTDNFKKILDLFRLPQMLPVDTSAATAEATTSSVYFTLQGQTPEPTKQRTRSPATQSTPSPSLRVTRPLPLSESRPIEPTREPTPTMAWYVNIDSRICISDGNQPERVEVYDSKELCCSKHYNTKIDYYNCISDGGDSTDPIHPQESGAESSTMSGCPPDATGWHTSSDCKSFFMCKKGEQFGMIMSCEDGFLFDYEVHSCRPDFIVKCDSL
jgi:hypothetical protein